MLGQLYPWPSRAHSLLPLNLPNYASHELFSHSIAVISEPDTLCFSFSTTFYISFHLLSSFLGLSSLLPCTLFCFLLFRSTPPAPHLRHPHLTFNLVLTEKPSCSSNMSLRPMWPLPPGFASRSYCILPHLATSPLHPAAKPPLPLSLQALNLAQPIISHACILFFTQTQYLHRTHLHPVNSGAQHSTAPVNLQSSIHAHTTINTNTLKK